MSADLLYVTHMLECVGRIGDYTRGGREAFMTDTRTQDAVLHNLQLIGESARRVSEELKGRHAHVAWTPIAGLRNVIVHDYLTVNVKRVWEIVEGDLTPLRVSLETILQELETDPPRGICSRG